MILWRCRPFGMCLKMNYPPKNKSLLKNDEIYFLSDEQMYLIVLVLMFMASLFPAVFWGKCSTLWYGILGKMFDSTIMTNIVWYSFWSVIVGRQRDVKISDDHLPSRTVPVMYTWSIDCGVCFRQSDGLWVKTYLVTY